MGVRVRITSSDPLSGAGRFLIHSKEREMKDYQIILTLNLTQTLALSLHPCTKSKPKPSPHPIQTLTLTLTLNLTLALAPTLTLTSEGDFQSIRDPTKGACKVKVR